MLIILKLKRILLRHCLHVKWHNLVLIALGYLTVCWLLLKLSGEQQILEGETFLYWVVVTASTVGYGDFSPTTAAGKLITAVFVIPFGLGLFGLTLGRLTAYIAFQWRKGVKGLRSLDYDNHIVVIGWNEIRTRQLLNLLVREISDHTDKKGIVLCARQEIDNPMPESIGFVRVSSFTDDNDMARAAIGKAGCVIIDCLDDDITASATLYIATKTPTAHIITYFSNESMGHLLKNHFPNIEPMPAVITEMLAKSAMDPGSSALLYELLNADKGMTQYSALYRGTSSITVARLFLALKEQHDATLVGVFRPEDSQISINPALDFTVTPGTTLYYISDERIKHIEWESLHA
ncbi:potassium channel family protein [Halomonas sp. V046]|uniref:potassium channel family protein n=1 Tax=Halomonas sp. V046 TaxID=3459611 RepID=UPI004044B517